MTAIASLVERSAELKRELLEFSWQPRFDRERREVLRDHLADRFVGDEAEVITALDYFLLQHELRSGKTVVERFVASRPDLPEHERELLLGWRDVVEGIFEVRGRDGDALVVENLVDELTYRVYSNMGPGVFQPLESGGFVIGRLVPVGPEWLISGNFACYPKSDRVAIHRTACEMAMRYPKWAFRNPDKLARARQQQSAEHDRFVQFFGADFLVIPGAQLTERMRSFYTFCRDQVVAELAASGKRPKHRAVQRPGLPCRSGGLGRGRGHPRRGRWLGPVCRVRDDRGGVRRPEACFVIQIIADECATTSTIPPFRPCCSSGWPRATPSVRTRCSVNCWGESTSTGRWVARS